MKAILFIIFYTTFCIPVNFTVKVLANIDGAAGIAVDDFNNIYISSQTQQCIFKVDNVTGSTTVLAGRMYAGGYSNGPGNVSQFNQPRGLAVDRNGNVFVADSQNNAIRMIDTNNVVTTFIGQPGFGSSDGSNGTASFNNPSDLVFDLSGNLLVADTINNAIRLISMKTVSANTVAGSTVSGLSDGQGIFAKFRFPQGITMASNGLVYISDTNNNVIRVMNSSKYVSTLPQSVPGPIGIAVDELNNVFVADSFNSAVRVIEPSGSFYILKNSSGQNLFFNQAFDLVFDKANNLIATDIQAHTVKALLAQPKIEYLLNPSGPVIGNSPFEVFISGFYGATLNSLQFTLKDISLEVTCSDYSFKLLCVSPLAPISETYGIRISLNSSIYGSTSVTLSQAYTYNAPEIQSISPSSGVVTGGTNISITGMYFGNLTTSIIQFGTVNCMSPVVVNDNLITCTTPEV